MSEQAALRGNKDQAKLKLETKIVVTSHNSVATKEFLVGTKEPMDLQSPSSLDF